MGTEKRYDVRRPEYEFVAGRLQAARKEAGLTQKVLAQRAGSTVRSVANWERACRYPRAGELRRLAEALEKPVSYFMDEAEAVAVHEEALALVVRLLQRAMRGEVLAGAFDAETGDPTLLDHDRRRQLTAGEAALRDYIRASAPGAWGLLDAAAQRELLEALARREAHPAP